MTRRAATALACLAITSAPVPAWPQVSEDAVKAAFLPRFASYVEWPPSVLGGGQTLYICVIGHDPFGAALDRAASASQGDGRSIEVRRLRSAANADGCHIAFVSGSVRQPVGEVLATFAERSVMTVTDARSGSQRGIIHFVVARGRVRFFIDDAEAAERGLTISSRLLALAVGVRKRAG